ncbi:MAG: class I SAM-dependent methyltransferase [bacterium]
MSNTSTIALLTPQEARETHLPSCQRLAHELGIPLLEDAPEADFILHYQNNALTLTWQQGKPSVSIHADWVHGKASWRRGQPELISKAIGSQRLPTPHIVDATAGLGRDSLVLASLPGHQSTQPIVTAIERSPTVFALLRDAQCRALQASNNPELVALAQRIRLTAGDSSEQLTRIARQQDIDIVYLDPMYPARQKKAQVKKDMRIFQALLGEATQDNAQLLHTARETATYRVVVKRPLKGEHLAGQKPAFSIKGRSTRFDVYTRKKLP